jgi:hypothetical protein
MGLILGVFAVGISRMSAWRDVQEEAGQMKRCQCR